MQMVRQVSAAANRSSCLAVLLLAFFAGGCTSRPTLPSRILWPPIDPKIEFIATYATANDLPHSPIEKTLDALLGAEPGGFQRPFAVTTDSVGRILVTDSRRARIYRIDLARRKIESPAIEATIHKPMGIAIGDGGRLFVVDNYAHQVVVLGADFGLELAFGAGSLKQPTYIALDLERGRVYIADSGAHDIKVFDPAGKLLQTIGEPGFLPGQFYSPHGMAIDRDGRLFVADTLNARIQVFSPTGKLLTLFGERGDATGQFESPKDLGIDSDGHLYVVDGRRGSFAILGSDGTLLLSVGRDRPTFHPLGFALANAIHIDPSDRILIADAAARRLSVWQYLSPAYLGQHPVASRGVN